MSKYGRKIKQPPEGFDYVEPTLTALENELREKVNEPHEGLRKTESQWPVHQINWQKSRYIYDLYYTYNRISKEVYDYCITNKIVDAALIAKWKKPGYERLCSTYTINPKNYKFGTVSICRVPKQNLAPGLEIEDPITGCRGCASGNGGVKNIFGNKYGQYLAAIQVAREERLLSKQRELEELEQEEEEEENKGVYHQSTENRNQQKRKHKKNDDNDEPVRAADGSSGKSTAAIWAEDNEELDVKVEELYGQSTLSAEEEAKAAIKYANKMNKSSHNMSDERPHSKRMKH